MLTSSHCVAAHAVHELLPSDGSLAGMIATAITKQEKKAAKLEKSIADLTAVSATLSVSDKVPEEVHVACSCLVQSACSDLGCFCVVFVQVKQRNAERLSLEKLELETIRALVAQLRSLGNGAK